MSNYKVEIFKSVGSIENIELYAVEDTLLKRLATTDLEAVYRLVRKYGFRECSELTIPNASAFVKDELDCETDNEDEELTRLEAIVDGMSPAETEVFERCITQNKNERFFEDALKAIR